MKTNELSGALLDYWVAKAEWGDWQGWESDEQFLANAAKFHPSTDWKDGGPIIERKGIGIHKGLSSVGGQPWEAWISVDGNPSNELVCEGATPLEAAMRCYVASKATPEQIAEWVKETRK